MKISMRLGILTIGTAAAIGTGTAGAMAGERTPEPGCPAKTLAEAQEKTVNELLPCGPAVTQGLVKASPIYLMHKDTKVKDLPDQGLIKWKTEYEKGLVQLGLK